MAINPERGLVILRCVGRRDLDVSSLHFEKRKWQRYPGFVRYWRFVRIHEVLRERDKPRQGVVATSLKFHRNGAVGFIDWLGDYLGLSTSSSLMRSIL